MKLLTLARDLQRRKGRERQHRFVAEGVRTVEALLASPLAVTGLLAAEALLRQPRGAALVELARTRGIPVQEVSDVELASASDTESPQGVLAVADIPATSADAFAPSGHARYLVLDALQDPGNAGTIVRTAAALGVTATIALPGTVDLWNAKVVRSSMGALFHHPVAFMPWSDFAAFLARADVALWAADLEGEPLPAVASGVLPARLALVVSNEGAGLTPAVAEAVTRRLRIPMNTAVESFNVAAAAAIVLYALGVAQSGARSS